MLSQFNSNAGDGYEKKKRFWPQLLCIVLSWFFFFLYEHLSTFTDHSTIQNTCEIKFI